MIRRILYILLLSGLFVSAQDTKSKFEVETEDLINLAFTKLHFNKYHEAFTLLDSTSRLLANTKHYILLSKKHNIYGLAYAQINAFDSAKKSYAIAETYADSISQSDAKLERKFVVMLNLQRLRLIMRDYDGYFKAYDEVRNILPSDKVGFRIFHEYNTEVVVLKETKKYKKLLQLCEFGLLEIEQKKHLFLNKNAPEALVLDYKRIKANFSIHYAFALMELGRQPDKANQLLDDLIRSDLENILWKKKSQYEILAEIRYYKAQYFSKYHVNKDSVDYYLNQYRTYVNNTLLYLEKEERNGNKYLIENLQNKSAIEKTKLLLNIEKKNSSKILTLAISTGVITLLSLFFLFHIKKSNLYKTRINKALESKNAKLKNSIDKRIDLEQKIANIQDAIAKDLHDNFGNRLAGLMSSADILLDMKNDGFDNDNQFQLFFNHFKTSVYHLNSDIKDLVWSNNAKNNKLSNVVRRLEKTIQDFNNSTASKIIYKNNLNLDYDLPQFWNRQILLIVKEAITNACKYSNGNKVIVSVEEKNHVLKISVKDKGEGFDLDKMDRRSGIENMKQRAESIDCTLTITSTIGKGTEVVFSGKLDKELF